MRRRLYQLAVILASLFIINGLSRGLIELSAQDRRLGRAQTELKKLKDKEVELKQQLEYFRSDEYVEKIARDKLLMAKPDETVLLLPKSQTQSNQQFLPAEKRAMSRVRIEPEGEWQAKVGTINNQQSDDDLPNWQKWAKLFGW